MSANRILWVSSLVLVAAACGGSDATPPPERYVNRLAQVDESRIHAALVEGGVDVSVPVHRLAAGGRLDGELRIELLDASRGEETSLARGSIAIAQAEADASHDVRLTLATDLERAQTAPVIIRWMLDLSRDDLFGRRSLFAALGNLDVQVRGPSEVPADGTSPLRVVVRDPITHAAVEGANVVAALTHGTDTPVTEPLFDGTTDEHGELLREITLPDGVDAGSIRVTVTHADAQVWTSRNVRRSADGRLYLGTDKTIYKPGQDVHLRLLALDGADRMPAANRDVLFEARDARGNKVFRRRARTDAFGVASAVVPTDTRVFEGDWVFHAELDGRQTDLHVPVRAYVLPKMRIDVGAEGAFAMPGDVVHFHLNAAYMFGEPVGDAVVTVAARTASGVPVTTVTGRTDRQGQYDFDVAVPDSLRTPALEESGDTLLVSANVVDAAEQAEQGDGSVVLAAAPLRIQAVAEDVTAGTESSLFVVVTDPLGRPVQSRVEVPSLGTDAVDTSAAGVAELRFTPTAATLSVDITATDGAGRTHTRSFSLGGGTERRLSVSTDRATYHAGDTARLRVSAASGIDRVYVDVYRGARGILSTTVSLTDGRAEVSLPIDASLGGLLVVDALGVTASGESVRASRPVLVEREDHLRITISSDRETYAPGDEAHLDVSVQDASGAPQVASVGLAIVDEAVFALGGEPTTTIQRSFGLDTRAIPASASVGGRTADDVLSNGDAAEREQLARVLFASAGDVTAPNFDYDSVAEELPQVRDSLATRLSWDAQQLMGALMPLASSGFITPDNVRRVVMQQTWIDPFGRPYHLSIQGTDQWSLMLTLGSDGPDERAGSPDDVSAQTYLSSLFYPYAMRGGGVDGEGDWAAANGGPPMAGAPAPPPAPNDPTVPGHDQAGGVTIRTDFREAAYVNPTLITDATGRATVSVPLAHSITTWRASADGSSANGRIGSARHALRTFQDFFVDFDMPARLTAGDVVELPAIVYNYLPDRANVTVQIEPGDWFELQSAASQSVDLGPSEVRAVRFRMRIAHAGHHTVTVRGLAGSATDGLMRTVDVQPEGQPEDQTVSGQLDGSRTHSVVVPDDTVEGGASMELVLTPGFAAEAVSGMESMLHEPNGCFEQTNSTAWPNTLVASYLERTGQMTDEKREEVIALVTRGYQRLVTFESPTGGINWWGDGDPGNRILTAIFLWHLKDLEPLIETDTAVRDRMLEWLVAQQNADGSWEAGDQLHTGDEVLSTTKERTTAFIAWALAHTGWAEPTVMRAADYLRANVPPESDLYANALSANALAMIDPRGAVTNDLFARLDRAKVENADTGVQFPSDTPSWTGAGGDAAAIETTGLVAYGLVQAHAFPDDAAGALRFIIANKDSVGTWYNTQATMNALRALSAGVSGSGSDAVGTLVVTVNGAVAETIDVNEDNRDLFRRFDLSELVAHGANDVRLDWTGTGELSYRLTRRAFRPALPGTVGPFSLDVQYDATSASVGSPVGAVVRATNNGTGIRDQVMVQVGRAPGFTPIAADLDTLVATGVVSRYEIRTDDVTFYLMGVAGGETRELRFRLIPGLAEQAVAPASSIYSYYEPSLRSLVDAVPFSVVGPET